MHSDWYIVVVGAESEMGLLRELLQPSAEHAIELDPGSDEWRLRSTRLAGLADHDSARTTSLDLLSRLSDAASTGAGRPLHLRPGALGRTRADGRHDVFVHPEPASARAQVFAPTILINGVAAETLGAKVLRLQETSPELREAAHALASEPTWLALYKAFEAIENGNGGERQLIARGLASRAETRRFKRTANSEAAAGDAARHARSAKEPPNHPMSLTEADEFVRRVLSQWVSSLDWSRNGGGRPNQTNP